MINEKTCQLFQQTSTNLHFAINLYLRQMNNWITPKQEFVINTFDCLSCGDSRKTQQDVVADKKLNLKCSQLKTGFLLEFLLLIAKQWSNKVINYENENRFNYKWDDNDFTTQTIRISWHFQKLTI